jgi:hypothetical protein
VKRAPKTHRLMFEGRDLVVRIGMNQDDHFYIELFDEAGRRWVNFDRGEMRKLHTFLGRELARKPGDPAC